MEERHQHKVAQMIKSAEGSAGLLHKITKPTAWRGGAQILVNEEEDARLMDRCEAKRKEWAKRWRCDEEVQNASTRLNKRNARRNRGVFRQGGAEWKVAATSMHDDVLLDIEECHE